MKVSNKLIGSVLLFVCFFLSLFTIIFRSDARTHYLIKYPVAFEENSNKYELHYLKKHSTLEKNAEELVKDFFLGPYNYSLEKYFDPQVKVNSTLLRDHILYIDLSPGELVHPRNFDETAFLRGLEELDRTIQNNLRTVKDIRITLDGQELLSDFFSL